ncbi:MAG: HAD family hydrolase [Candidatus Hodarchaeales archaeon]|jgi:FMN phosphatase YigB (HAD superfamily)
MIKNVILDFWNTLFYSTPENTAKIHEKRLERLKLAINDVIPSYTLKNARKDFNIGWNKVKEIRQSGQLIDIGIEGHSKLIASIMVPVVTPSFHSEIKNALLMPIEKWVEPMPGAIKLVKTLYNENINIGLISNTGIDAGIILEKILEKNGIKSYFKCRVYSDAVGYLKPHPLPFKKCLQDLILNNPSDDMITDEDTIIVGDTINTDILGGQLMGLKTVLFRDNGFHKAIPFPEIEGQVLAPDYIITDLVEIIDGIIHDS